MTRLISSSLWVALIVLVSAAARGADAGADAKLLFKQGVAAYESENYEAALDAFHKAMALQPSWRIYYNIAQCEEMQKRHGLALEAFELYLSQGGDDIQRSRQDEVLAEVTRLRSMVGTVEIKGRQGDEVAINGRPRGALPLASRLSVEMGPVTVEVRRGERTVLHEEFRLSGLQHVFLNAPEERPTEPRPVFETPPTKPHEETRPSALQSRPKRVWAYVAAGVGAAAAVAAASTGGVVLARSNRLEYDCPDKECDSEHEHEIESVKSLSTATDVLWGVAGVGIAAGVVLFFVEPNLRSGHGETATLSLAPQKGGAAVLWSGHF